MKVLVVDDSIVFRSAIKTALEGASEVSSVQVASNGKIALEFLRSNQYDLVTLDIEMPVMDGIETIKEIRKTDQKIKIIVFSSQNPGQVNKTLSALSLGANDFVQKVEGSTDIAQSIEMIKSELVPIIRALVITPKDVKIEAPPAKKSLEGFGGFSPDAIFIGCSTGGPDALRKLFTELKLMKLTKPMFIVQHMPPVFTTQLAKMLQGLVSFEVKEAEHSEKVRAGVCYVAPGDYHMDLVQKAEGGVFISLNQNPKICYVRPAVDATLAAISKIYRQRSVAMILTGMGDDGQNGCRMIKEVGGKVVIQDKESCVVWGMPGAVHRANLHDGTLSLMEFPPFIIKMGAA